MIHILEEIPAIDESFDAHNGLQEFTVSGTDAQTGFETVTEWAASPDDALQQAIQHASGTTFVPERVEM